MTAQEIEAGNRIRVMIAHGKDDRTVGVERSQRARDLLREAGYRVQFESIDGGPGVLLCPAAGRTSHSLERAV